MSLCHTDTAQSLEDNVAGAAAADGAGYGAVDHLVAAQGFGNGRFVRDPVRKAQHRRHLIGVEFDPLQRGAGVEGFQGEQGHVEGSVAKRIVQRGDDLKGRRVDAGSFPGLAPRIQGKVEAQAAGAQLLGNGRLLDKDHRVPSQSQAAPDICPDRAGAKGQDLQLAVHTLFR